MLQNKGKSFEIQDAITSFSWKNCHDNTKPIFSLVILQLSDLVLRCYRILPAVYLQSRTRVVETLKLDQVFPIHPNQCWKMIINIACEERGELIRCPNFFVRDWRYGASLEGPKKFSQPKIGCEKSDSHFTVVRFRLSLLRLQTAMHST